MKQNLYAIFTDLHLGIHQNSTLWHRIANEWADWFIKDAQSRGISKLLFTGDFFHSRSEISVNTVHFASEFLDKFKDFEIIMIPGNHDCYYKDKADIHSLSILKGYNNITIYDKLTVLNIGNKTVTLCPWGFNIKDVPKSDVILGHFEIESFKMSGFKLCERGFKPKDLLERSSLIFSGHFHLHEEREYEEGKIIYTGSPFQQDFSDRDTKKGYYILNTDNLEHSFIENNVSPRHKKVYLSRLLKDTAFNDDFFNNIKSNFIKLVVDTKINQDEIDSFIARINKLEPNNLIVDPLINYDLEISEDSTQDLSGIDMSQAIVEFINMLDIDNKENIINHTLHLYTQIK